MMPIWESVAHLIVAAAKAPHEFECEDLSLIKDDNQFLHAVARFGGLPDDLLRFPHLLGRNLHALRADFSACAQYRPSANEKVSCPITLLGSHADPLATMDRLSRWSDLGAKPPALTG